MKATRIMSVLMAIVLLAVCPGAAFARSDAEVFSVDWWMEAMEIWADSCDFGAEWEYVDRSEPGVTLCNLYLAQKDKYKVIRHNVLFGIADLEDGYDSLDIVSEYDDSLANDLRFYNQLSFLLEYVLYSTTYATEGQYEDCADAVNDAMNCIIDILGGNTDQHFEFTNNGIDLVVFNYEIDPGRDSIAISMIYNTGVASTAAFNDDYVLPQTTPQTVFNGKIIVNPGYDCVCPFTVEAPENTNCYVYLRYICTPPHSVVDRRQSNMYAGLDGDIAVYVGAGRTVEIDVPIGVYKLYYATGTDFYGTDTLFGDDTRCYSSDDLFNFYADDEYYQGHIVTLYTVANGNLDTDPIPEDQFPKR